MSKSNICKKCKNKVACALGDTKGSSKYFSEGKEQISFYYSVDSAYDYKVILIAESDDTVIAKETMIFDSIEVNEDINVLSRAVPFIQLRCMKHLAMKELRKKGVRVKVVNK